MTGLAETQIFRYFNEPIVNSLSCNKPLLYCCVTWRHLVPIAQVEGQPLMFQHCPLVAKENQSWWMKESLDLRVKASGSGEQMGCWQSPAGPPLVVSPRDWKWLNTFKNTWDSNINSLLVQATRLSNKSIRLIVCFFYFPPYGFISAAAQHQHFIWLLVRWLQWKDVLSGCGDLGRGQLFHTNNIIDRQVISKERSFGTFTQNHWATTSTPQCG